MGRKTRSRPPGSDAAHPPIWIEPQLTRLVEDAPAGAEWLHEIKFDGYRMHARLDRGQIRLLTRTGLDWSQRYQHTVESLRTLPVQTAYLDGELCAVRPDGITSFSRLQAAMDEGAAGSSQRSAKMPRTSAVIERSVSCGAVWDFASQGCQRFACAGCLGRFKRSPGSIANASAICPNTVTLGDTSARSMAPT
jgi:hypothetical protein